MKIYHGHASPTDLQSCRDAAPGYEHGVGWSDPDRMVIRDEAFFADNGAYTGFEPATFIEILDTVSRQPQEPDFIVLPDKLDDWEQTVERHRGWFEVVDDYGYDYYIVGQPPATDNQILSLAFELDASGVFLGGSNTRWKFDIAKKIDCMPVHIGSPGLGPNLIHAARVADSIDTTSIVVNDYYHHLEQLEQQQTMESVQ